ncbi:zinc-finger domain-containing protein [Sporosarcina ureilytica]|uniref:Zinc-finger domain-containing protein n=1 Tax=Sporosarcina ureilytica TaxID=298596 RepID=A0A1D8JGY5_9BACL|nr:zinc-finger domain-containing protein [Sporosarcina ureilytica]AOV07961.1 hypothetical protein BI350_10710 [Sporosarcina ureilytica]
MKRLNVMSEIDTIMDTYCMDCFLKKTLAKDKGKTAAHRFCIKECTIGEQLRFLGEEMNKRSN